MASIVHGLPRRSIATDPESRIVQALEDLFADCAAGSPPTCADDSPDSSNNAALPYRHVIPGIARQITLMQRVDASPERTRRAKKELMKVSKMAADLASAISGLSHDAMGALDRSTRFQAICLGDDLSNIATASKNGAATFPNESKGAPHKFSAVAIVEFLHQEYERLIGKPPTLIVASGKAGGPFLGLVKTVFKALSIKASPEATVRKVMEQKKKRDSI
jgi:hypothetical protein